MEDSEIIKIGISLFILISVALIAMRKGTTKMKKPSRIKSFYTNASIDKAMKTIIQFAQLNGYKVDDFNESEAIIVLSDSVSLTSYGYIYPIYLVKQSDDSLQIDIGITMKAGGYIGLDASLERCFNGIRTAIYAIS